MASNLGIGTYYKELRDSINILTHALSTSNEDTDYLELMELRERMLESVRSFRLAAGRKVKASHTVWVQRSGNELLKKAEYLASLASYYKADKQLRDFPVLKCPYGVDDF